jgi:hypothetical protein
LCNERVHLLGPGETSVIDNPKFAVLVPGEVAQEMVFGVDIVAEGHGTEKSVKIADVRELAEDLSWNCLATATQCENVDVDGMKWYEDGDVMVIVMH